MSSLPPNRKYSNSSHSVWLDLCYRHYNSCLALELPVQELRRACCWVFGCLSQMISWLKFPSFVVRQCVISSSIPDWKLLRQRTVHNFQDARQLRSVRWAWTWTVEIPSNGRTKHIFWTEYAMPMHRESCLQQINK